jgi:Uma2 family endonuclease
MLEPGLEDAVREFFREQHPAHDVEIRNGEMVVVSPHDFVSSNVVIRLGRILSAFVDEYDLGFVSESNGGYRYDDGDMMAPDVSYISKERLPRAPRTFATAVPELVVEIQSSSQRPSAVRAKLALLLEMGSSVGVYIDPGTHRVEVHRVDAQMLVLGDGDTLELPDILPGLQIAIADLWPRDFR